MDTPNLQEEVPSSSMSPIINRKRKAVDKDGENEESAAEIVPSKRVYYSPPTQRQNWSLPDSIIYYIAKNINSPETYQKLISTCKYFFYKNPILVCSDLTFDVYDSNSDHIVKSDDGDPDFDRVINVSKIEAEQNGSKCVMDLKNTSQKLWITDKIYIKTGAEPELKDFMTLFIPRIYQCDAKEVTLYGFTITFNDFVFLASKAEEINYFDVRIINDDGSVAPFEKLVEVTENVKMIDIDNDYVETNFSPVTIKNLLKIPQFLTLNLFSSTAIPGDSFDIETFYAYMKKNKQTGFILWLSPISDAYKDRLVAIEDELLENEDDLDYKAPFIVFDEQDDEKRKDLMDIFLYTHHHTF